MSEAATPLVELVKMPNQDVYQPVMTIEAALARRDDIVLFVSKIMKRDQDFGVIPGSMVYIPAELANPPQVDMRADTPVKVAIAFLTKEGYCGAQDGGLVYNYSETKFVFPDAVSATAMFRRQQGLNQFVATLNSEGEPSANARIGDYADATLLTNAPWNVTQECVGLGDVLEMTYIPA